jgi:hypothetical protein
MRAAIILSLLGFSLCVAASADEAAAKDCVDAGARRFQVSLSRRRELAKRHPSLVRAMTRHSHWKSKSKQAQS